MKCLREVIGAFPESSAKVRLQFQQPLLHKLKQSVLLWHSDTTVLQKGWSGICSCSYFQQKYEGLTMEHPLCRWGLWLLNKLRKQSWGYLRRKPQLHFFKPSLTFSSRNSNQKSILFFVVDLTVILSLMAMVRETVCQINSAAKWHYH